jgi:hypothetical protein
LSEAKPFTRSTHAGPLRGGGEHGGRARPTASTPTPTPTPTPVDTDGDGVYDISDNCPYWPNPTQSLPPWPVPANDPDCDGFASADEEAIGTDAADPCANTSDPNDESDDRWPLDFDDSQTVDVSDLLGVGQSFKNSFGASDPDPGYHRRYDLNKDGTIDVLDLLGVPVSFKSMFGLSCTP